MRAKNARHMCVRSSYGFVFEQCFSADLTVHDCNCITVLQAVDLQNLYSTAGLMYKLDKCFMPLVL